MTLSPKIYFLLIGNDNLRGKLRLLFIIFPRKNSSQFEGSTRIHLGNLNGCLFMLMNSNKINTRIWEERGERGGSWSEDLPLGCRCHLENGNPHKRIADGGGCCLVVVVAILPNHRSDVLGSDCIGRGERKTEEKIGSTFGSTIMTSNIHDLLHVVDATLALGPAWAWSSFVTEHFAGLLKRFIIAPNMFEMQTCQMIHVIQQKKQSAITIFWYNRGIHDRFSGKKAKSKFSTHRRGNHQGKVDLIEWSWNTFHPFCITENDSTNWIRMFSWTIQSCFEETIHQSGSEFEN